MRSFVTADVLRRVLEYNGFNVIHVKNITDVGHLRDEGAAAGGDRVEIAAREAHKTPEEVVDFFTAKYLEDETKLNLLEPAFRPRATSYIPQMIDLTERLVDTGYAYATDGNVYFDVSRFLSYGKLSGNKIEDLVAGQRVDIEPDKRHVEDFALWKAADPYRFMQWDSPWGSGFPGWHIECSAMSAALLGPSIDIHTGGIDNLFPHHEDERAQSEAASGKQFVRYWVHTEYLLMDAEKMSKSLGNFATVPDLVERGIHPLAYRYFLFQAHYRRQLNISWEALEASQAALESVWDQAAEILQAVADSDASDENESFVKDFRAAINDDLGLPRGIAVLHNLLASKVSPTSKWEALMDMDRVLGLDIERAARCRIELLGPQRELIEERAAARQQRDWALSDQIRDRLAEMGVEVRDTPAGQRWIRRESSG
jgi:cysteinyl-tRNA synthetase